MSEKPLQSEIGLNQSEKPSPKNARAGIGIPARKNDPLGDDPVRNAVGGYFLLFWVLLLLSVVGMVIRWEALSTFAFWGGLVMLICAELARIAGRVGPPSAGDLTVSVLDASRSERRQLLRQRVALISIMSSAQDPEARIRAKRELDWMDEDLKRFTREPTE